MLGQNLDPNLLVPGQYYNHQSGGFFFDVEGHIVFKKTFAPAESFQNGCLADFFSFFVGGVL